MQPSGGGWVKLPALPSRAALQLNGERECNVSMTAGFRTESKLGTRAQIAVALWNATEGVDVDIFLLLQPLQKDELQASVEWQHVSLSLCDVLDRSGDIQSMDAAAGAHLAVSDLSCSIC